MPYISPIIHQAKKRPMEPANGVQLLGVLFYLWLCSWISMIQRRKKNKWNQNTPEIDQRW